MSSVVAHLDEALERVTRLRDELLADVDAPFRSDRLAAVFESEARAWSQLYELSTRRLVWMAALAAEARARLQQARQWRRRAVDEAASNGVVAGGPVQLAGAVLVGA
jgi:hypothetical protein